MITQHNVYRTNIPDKNVTVAITPNGYADGLAIAKDSCTYFVMPEECSITMDEFLTKLDDKTK